MPTQRSIATADFYLFICLLVSNTHISSTTAQGTSDLFVVRLFFSFDGLDTQLTTPRLRWMGMEGGKGGRLVAEPPESDSSSCSTRPRQLPKPRESCTSLPSVYFHGPTNYRNVPKTFYTRMSSRVSLCCGYLYLCEINATIRDPSEIICRAFCLTRFTLLAKC